ncbi:MAG: hypothetical protein ACYC5G_01540 [Candidatus Doudnabacteria bacterium]
MIDSETNPWESQDPDAWKQEQVEIPPNPEVRADLLQSLNRYADFLSHQNELDESLGMSDSEWIHIANSAMQVIWSRHGLDPSVASKESIEHLESLIQDAYESFREVGVIESRVRIEIVDELNKIREALRE